ncbi:hypothetical protein GH975_05685 [Litorivicinus lipolyticus]|uniref:Uncharacterized protein n=1 Tax=Litorivicinus lipolyticus TaxID=418701 RepID=A0A5Q2QE05_9GAMM|nr:hypothetical protein [Litorivicinus lipolyticus]QGG80090.1 hypothetical protein GH975_05685 [Litorivicinus lipolyticus]
MIHSTLQRQCLEDAVLYFEAIWHRPITPMEIEQLEELVRVRAGNACIEEIRRIAAGCAADLDYLAEEGEQFFVSAGLDDERFDSLMGYH